MLFILLAGTIPVALFLNFKYTLTLSCYTYYALSCPHISAFYRLLKILHLLTTLEKFHHNRVCSPSFVAQNQYFTFK
jgi:hypothetical protein